MNKIKSPDDKGIQQPGSKSFRNVEKHSHHSYSALFPWLIRPGDRHPIPERQHHEEHPGSRPCHPEGCFGPRPHFYEEQPGSRWHLHDKYPCSRPHHQGKHRVHKHLRPRYRYVHSRISLYIADSNIEKSRYFRILLKNDQ